jgi:hypothetical protein
VDRHGDDGQFSTFQLAVGTPGQAVNVLPVPFRNALVVVGSEGCLSESMAQNCSSQRGNLFHRDQSQTWHSVSITDWDNTETKIKTPHHHTVGNASVEKEAMFQHPVPSGLQNSFGTDSVAGKSLGKEWTIQGQGVMAVANKHPFVGLLGLGTNVNGPAKNPTSLFDHIRGVSGMRSASWSYTAGSKASE